MTLIFTEQMLVDWVVSSVPSEKVKDSINKNEITTIQMLIDKVFLDSIVILQCHFTRT